MNERVPTLGDLRKIRHWHYSDFEGLLAFVKSFWWLPDALWKRRGRLLNISTGGWSGNEELMEVLQTNQMFWVLCWYSSRRGGHYVFTLPSKKIREPRRKS